MINTVKYTPDNAMIIYHSINNRKLRSFNVCYGMLCMFYDTIICSVLSFALLCLGGNATEKYNCRLNKLIKKAGRCVGQNLEDIDSI